MSKTLTKHKFIYDVEYMEDGDHNYFVTLIPGYIFSNYQSRSKGFNTVKEALDELKYIEHSNDPFHR